MSKVTPFISVYGALEAIKYYEEVFGSTLVSITMLSEFPGYEDRTDKVAHSSLKIGESYIFINDNLEEDPLKEGDNTFFVIEFETVQKVEEVFSVLAEEGHIFEPLQKVTWSKLSGTVKDKFNISWMIIVA